MKIDVLIITCKRPEGLSKLLNGLCELTFEQMKPPDIQIIIVDNDQTASSQEVVASIAAHSMWPVHYMVEPRRGIPFARNTAMEYSLKGDANLFVFIDDDEVPEPSWLEQLVLAKIKYAADVVSGPVIPVYPEGTPNWIIKGSFFERKRMMSGQVTPYVATNNVLIDAEPMRSCDLRFSEKFALSGGSDTHFFLRASRLGLRMVWCDEAVVREDVPRSRGNVQWIIQRAYRLGNSIALCERDLSPQMKKKLIRIAKALVNIITGMVLLPIFSFSGKARRVRTFQRIARGLGMLAGMKGVKYEEYRRVHVPH